VLPHHAGQLVIDDFYEGLTGRQTTSHLLAYCSPLYAINKTFNHRQCDISFKQSHAHFAKRALDIFFSQLRLTINAGKGGTEFFCKRVKQLNTT
jgi:hypothetical protein